MLPFPIGTESLHKNPFLILPEHKRRHCAIFGKSGVGKSTLLRNMIAWDIQEGLGVTVLDPHGGLIDDLLDLIPKHRTNDVIYFNPQDPDHALGINILESVAKDQHPLVVSSVINILKNIWLSAWGQQTEFILSNAIFALLEQPDPQTLVALPKLLTNPKYREKILSHVTNPAVEWFFDLYDNHWNTRSREDKIAPPLNKVSKFITNPLLRDVIGQPRSSFDFRWAMDNNKIILCNLAKGALGEDVSSLLGSLVVTKISLAALSRQDTPEDERPLHVLYADEVQNFTHGVDFPTVLSEARKYHLALTIATQTLSQLPPLTLSAVFGNCATIISYRVSGEDADALQTEFATTLPAHLLQDLADFKLYIKTLMSDADGAIRPHTPKLVDAEPPFEYGGANTRERVLRTSRERYTRPRAEVEAKLDRFIRA